MTGVRDPGHAGEIKSLRWPGNASISPPEELDEVAGKREVWASLSWLLPLRPDPRKAVENGWLDGYLLTFDPTNPLSSSFDCLVLSASHQPEGPHICSYEGSCSRFLPTKGEFFHQCRLLGVRTWVSANSFRL